MSKKILSIDIGGHKILSGMVNEKGEVENLEKKIWQGEITKKKVMTEVKEMLDKLNKKYKGEKYIGITIPGLADTEKGIWEFSPFSGIRNVEIVDILNKRYGIPVFIENDVNACALGEKRFGVCQEVDNFFWITISNGIGGGLVLDGELYEGEFQNAGEIGHIEVVEDGFKCGCGNNGCLEAYAAGPAIVKRFRIAHQDSVNLKTEEIAELAKNGDKTALQIFKMTGRYIGKALAAAVNIINPHKVILGGGVTENFSLFQEELIKQYQKKVFLDANKKVEIQKTGLGYEAALIGIAAVVLDRISE